MGFTKLLNVKAGADAVPPGGVAVACRTIAAKRRKGGGEPALHHFAIVRIGGSIARKAGMSGVKHRVNILIGDGLERQRCGIVLDDKAGEFKLRRLKNGNYQLSIGERAAAGLLRMDAPPFTAAAELVPVAAGTPPCVMFDLSKEIRDAGSGGTGQSGAREGGSGGAAPSGDGEP